MVPEYAAPNETETAEAAELERAARADLEQQLSAVSWQFAVSSQQHKARQAFVQAKGQIVERYDRAINCKQDQAHSVLAEAERKRMHEFTPSWHISDVGTVGDVPQYEPY